ncbi:DUF3558 domain-containing protein [Haloechinothrix sp. LS1_15]|uniref:DUF3558 domain-containing protein n=1 Tax=Haloechinothrix sp. LS1_15 TaxID=2652248 RepID=UPI0029447D39|nr:DUF3558 domain-containing protein [Haloechinothrix sp. LS1_15]MDV6011128.1 DUF3558 domain-containing protein [Haloechinothrix sp. LS1_15]
MKSARTLAATALATLLLAACANDTPGEPEHTDGTNQEANAQEPADVDLPHSGAPAVDDPITELESFQRDPCSIFSEEELAETAGYPVADTKSDADGATGLRCRYSLASDDHHAGGFSAVLSEPGSEGLSHIYSLNEQGTTELFAEAEDIDGYPAVFASKRDRRDLGYCDVYVGIQDDITFTIQLSASDDRNAHHDTPCESAYELAELGMETLHGGAS